MPCLLTLYKYDRQRCACEETELKIWFDPSRKVAPFDDSLLGQIKRLWEGWWA